MKNKFGWEVKKLGEVCLFENGDRGVNYPSKSDRTDIGIPFVNAGHLSSNGIDAENMDYISREKYNQLGGGKFKIGDLLFCLRGSVGKYAVNNQFSEGTIASSLVIIRPNSSLITKFLMYYFGSQICKEMILDFGNGAAQPNLSAGNLKKFKIPVPPLPTQHQIVSELDALSEIISKKKQQLEELDKLAQATFYDMFGDPVSNEKGLTVKSLGEICEITSSKRIYAEEYQKDGIPFYRSKEIIEKGKKKPISLELYISNERYNEIKNKFGVPEIGDILMTAVGTIGEIWVVDTDSPFYFKDGNIVWLKMNKSNNSIYFLFVLGLLVKEYKAKMANGAAYSALTIVNLKNMDVVFPELDIQNQFASKIESIESQKSLITQSIAEVQQLFDYTMDKYFN